MEGHTCLYIILLSVYFVFGTFDDDTLKQFRKETDSIKRNNILTSKKKAASQYASVAERQKLISAGLIETEDYIDHDVPTTDSFDCKIKKLAFDFAEKILEGKGREDLYAGLELGALCNYTLPKRQPRSVDHKNSIREYLMQQEKSGQITQKEYFIGQQSGYRGFDKTSDGTFSRPFATLTAGIGACRAFRMMHPSVTCVLFMRKGTYFTDKPIFLGPEDSNMIISAYNDEDVTITGGRQIKPKWEKYRKDLEIYAEYNAVFEGVKPGKSTPQVKYIGKFLKHHYCHDTCLSDPLCSAYTHFDNTTGDFAFMCYIRTDGRWNPFKHSGVSSGKKVNASLCFHYCYCSWSKKKKKICIFS